MALSGLEIYKLLPKTNCRQCGFPTCLAFALALAKKSVALDKCPTVSDDAKVALESASLPPIRLIGVGQGDEKVEVGNETVMFRHEEKFHRPTAIGIILEDSLSETELKQAIDGINALSFERVGQIIKVNLIAIKNTKSKDDFAKTVKTVLDHTKLGIVLISSDPDCIKEGVNLCKDRKPLVYGANKDNFEKLAAIAKENKIPLVIEADNLDDLAELTKQVVAQGAEDLVLAPQTKSLNEAVWNFTQIRRLALKKNFRALGYPTCCIIKDEEPHKETIQASVLLAKYANIILIHNRSAWQILPILTLRQNIFTDPQKPLQVEPNVYPIGNTTKSSPLLVTTNFSLTYYTVLSEVEASKVPSYILSVDTEGMSVLTAWAAEKFTPESIAKSLEKFNAADLVENKKLVLPGYVAVMSGELEDTSKWQVVVGPREAAGISGFLKNL